MANRLKWIKIKDPIYGGELWVVVNKSCSRVYDYFKKRHINLFAPEGEASCTYLVDKNDNSLLTIMWLKKKSANLLSHEILHFVRKILEDKVGMPLNTYTSEAYAYYYQYIHYRITREW